MKPTTRFVTGALFLVLAFLPSPESVRADSPLQMGLRVYVYQVPGSNETVLMYGIAMQMMLDPHWTLQGEVDFANWMDSMGNHQLITIPASIIFQFLPGRPFNPYALAGLNYTNLTAGIGSSRSVKGTLGAQAGLGFVVSTQAVGFTIEGRYFLPDVRTPRSGSMVWGGGAAMGLGFAL